MSNCDCPECRLRDNKPTWREESAILRRTIADAIEALLAEPACNPDEYAYRAAHWETTAKIARRMLGRAMGQGETKTWDQMPSITGADVVATKVQSCSPPRGLAAIWTRWRQPDSAALMVGCHVADCSENARWKSNRNEFACDIHIHVPEDAKRTAL